MTFLHVADTQQIKDVLGSLESWKGLFLNYYDYIIIIIF